MPHSIYLVRLIHSATRRAFPGERLWTAAQLTSAATIRFLRLRNREGWDVYVQPYAAHQNAGYILLDLDAPHPTVLESMRRQGLEPCVVVQTSPGHLQVWLHISHCPLEPGLATAVARQLARTYGGDLASADWHHLGRLAGFTNRKPARRTPSGNPPWVIVPHARAGLASRAADLLQTVTTSWTPAAGTPAPIGHGRTPHPNEARAPASVTPPEAVRIYHYWTQRWRVTERFSQPNWSIVDLWVARALLSQGTLPAQVRAILQLGSPQFPRRHGDPQDYLRRTLARAAFSFAAPRAPVCATPATISTGGEIHLTGSSATGGP